MGNIRSKFGQNSQFQKQRREAYVNGHKVLISQLISMEIAPGPFFGLPASIFSSYFDMHTVSGSYNYHKLLKFLTLKYFSCFGMVVLPRQIFSTFIKMLPA
jgi:hypothetical protein